ncbi:testis-specific serine/threonine-protein kinase 2 [Platysternon megacephalum]|uniref:Testis-specific serine/threonine-protein kinase 2 n=1 Tax=Platysternon megacephalum TaxID=55544 RepID=A0A4D9EY40_9SAUR|nr:testis-specific serine/threonine-protein kinase 2 [Platysternon megacephalum]
MWMQPIPRKLPTESSTHCLSWKEEEHHVCFRWVWSQALRGTSQQDGNKEGQNKNLADRKGERVKSDERTQAREQLYCWMGCRYSFPDQLQCVEGSKRKACQSLLYLMYLKLVANLGAALGPLPKQRQLQSCIVKLCLSLAFCGVCMKSHKFCHHHHSGSLHLNE